MMTKRILTRVPEYNKFHDPWSFTYRLKENGNRVQYLDKMDLDYVGGRDQIKIWLKSVMAYVEERTDMVSVHMNLPSKVDRIIIFQFGKLEPVCYAENQGKDVYPGIQLDKNPFTFEEELRRIRMSRRRRKLLF